MFVLKYFGLSDLCSSWRWGFFEPHLLCAINRNLTSIKPHGSRTCLVVWISTEALLLVDTENNLCYRMVIMQEYIFVRLVKCESCFHAFHQAFLQNPVLLRVTHGMVCSVCGSSLCVEALCAHHNLLCEVSTFIIPRKWLWKCFLDSFSELYL